jgi:inorganic phosphate transporter, PiT family
VEILSDLTPLSGLLLVTALIFILGFEFVNGFHDTANAVATVIYTNTLKPTPAVIWSGCWNLIGVLTSSGAVAFGIISLLPIELVINGGSIAGFIMVFAIIISAIIWNLGTWYFGLPVSSSHTLIGTILGVGLANSMLHQSIGEGVNWEKIKEVFASLLISPAIGFICAGLLLLLVKTLIRSPELYTAPQDRIPPLWIRAILMLTCTGVSFAHGSNDGQKGMGLIVLILIGILPGIYAIDLHTDPRQIFVAAQPALVILDRHVESKIDRTSGDKLSEFLAGVNLNTDSIYPELAAKSHAIARILSDKNSLKDLSKEDRFHLRNDLYFVSKTIAKLNRSHRLTPDESPSLMAYQRQLNKTVDFIPIWVKFAVATALGIGTTVGWKRIVATVGDKIGTEPLTYAQGATAELVAMSTIMIADRWGLPVSTTHVLSSGVAGTMAANRSGLQMDTLRNLLLAWVLTLPVCIGLSWAIFTGATIAISQLAI